MSKINELIEQLCPKGVKRYPLKDFFKISIGQFVHKDKQSPDGKYPVYNGGIIPTGLYDDYNNTGNKIIISARGANAGYINRIERNFWAGNSCYSLEVNNEKLLNYIFAYYYLKANQNVFTEQQQKGGIPAVSKKQVENFYIPIPPIQVQQEIVKILDQFTALDQELNNELQARKQQYNFYLNQLLSFDNKEMITLSLGDVCLKTKNIKWKERVGEEFYYIDLSAVNLDNNKIEDLVTINSENAPSRAQQITQTNDIIFGTTRPTQKRYAVIPENLNNQICSTGFCVLRANTEIILPNYIFYILKTETFFNYVVNNQEGAGYPSISNTKIKNFRFPVPSLEEQERIVKILDQFDALVNDTTVGLPAEINARKQQYEYYRNQLLTFKPLD